jgi:hypothetical protein
MLLGVIFVVTSAITPSQVYHRAHIPVLIPSVLQNEATRVYESVDIAQAGKYKIFFGLVANCNEATACDVGTVTGGISEDISDPQQQHVHLRDGTSATYVPFRCGASCGVTSLGFFWHHVWYVLHLKSATEAETLRAANSMLPR